MSSTKLSNYVKNSFVLMMIFGLFANVFAQSIPGGSFPASNGANQRFLNQERAAVPYTQNACEGAYVNTRIYLNNDKDGDGLKDYNNSVNTFHLKDNMEYVGNNANTRRVALITPKGIPLDNGNSTSAGSTTYYYSPQSNMLGVRFNNISNSIDSTRAWYRFSKVAPINQPVRAVTSEAMFIEQPASSLNPSDRYIQAAYQLRYATYRSINNNTTSNYQAFPVASMDDFSSLGSSSSWFLKTPIPNNAGLGPNWNADYSQTSNSITTPGINRGPEQTHGLECINYNLSRCGDGYIDVSGSQPTNGSSTQPYIISDNGVTEACDPGANLSSFADDIMPGGATPTANYNCTSTCTIINPSITLAITKLQRNLTTNVPLVGYTGADINFSSGDDIEFQMTISTQSPGVATNVVLNDTLPSGFVLSASPNAVTVDGANTSVTVGVNNTFSLPLGTMTHTQTKTIIVRGKMMNASNTTFHHYNNTAGVTYSTPGNPNNTAGPVTVYQNPIGAPIIKIDKSQSTGSTVFGADTARGIHNSPATINYTVPTPFTFTIKVKNTGTASATNVTMKDILPVGFTFISCTNANNITCTNSPSTEINSAAFNLAAGAEEIFVINGTMNGIGMTTNTASAFLSGIIQDTDYVQQTPLIVSPTLALTKLVRNVTKNLPNGSFAQADSQNDAVAVSGGDTIQYQLIVTASGTAVTQDIKITDTFPTTGVTINSITVSGVTIPNPSTNPFDITIPASAFANTGAVVILINATVSTTANSDAYVNLSEIYYGNILVLEPKSDNVAWINIGPKPAPNLVIEKTIADGSGGFAEGITLLQGQIFQMRLRVTNIGSASTTGVYIRDICPAGLTCTSYTYNGQTTSITNNTIITPNLAPANGLLPGGSIDIFVNGTVNATANNQTLRNIACVNTGSTFPTDPTPSTVPLSGSTSPCNAAEIIVPTFVEPILTLTKTVVPGPNVSTNQIVRYTIVVANNSQGVAYNTMLGDIFPWSQLSYLGNLTVIPSTVIVNVNTSAQTFSGNLGTLSPGQSVTISFDARVLASAPAIIINTAKVNYTNIKNEPKPPLEASVPLTIINPPVSRCGDGVLSRLEQCDMAPCRGTGSVNGGAGTIGLSLDSCGTTSSSTQYVGKACTSSCKIEGNSPLIPACRYADTVISVMEDEVLPIAHDIEVKPEDLVDICNISNANKLKRDSLRCTFMLFNKDEEGTQGSSLVKNMPCNTKEWTVDGNKLYEAFKSDPLFARKDHTPYGSFLVDMTSNLINNGYGEYKVSLEDVNYEYCDGSTWRTGSPYARVCQINIAVTRPYLMQKSNTVYKPNDSLNDFFTLGKGYQSLVSATQFDSLSEQTKLSNLEYKGKVKTLTEDLLKKYEKLAITVNASNLGALGVVKKVPGKSIYIMDSDGGMTLEGNALGTTPTTLIVKGSGIFTIEGSVGANMLILVPNGSVKFKQTADGGSDQYSSDEHRCGTQVIRGIVIAKQFVASDKNLRNTRANVNNHPRCRKGNLQIYGALYGNNLDDLVQSRRSHLEHRFTYQENFGINSAPSESQKNAERRDEIYKGASVYIEQNPSLWRDMPPGALEFLQSFNVSRN